MAASLAGLAVWRARVPGRSPRLDGLLAAADQAMRLAEPDAERQGVDTLRKAVALAPGDPLAWGKLALALRASADYAPPAQAAAVMAAADDAARNALAFDSRQPDARTARLLEAPIQGNWGMIERGLKAILADTPDHLPTLDALSIVQASAGLVRMHYPVRLRTVALDPLHAGYNLRAIYAHWMNGNLAAADRAGARGLELWPRHFATFMARSMLFAYSGRPERALALLAAADAPAPPALIAVLTAVTRALATGRDADRAAAFAALDSAILRGGPLLAVVASMSFAALGAVKQALAVTEAFLLELGPVMAGSVWRPGQPSHTDVRRRFTNYLFTPVMMPLWDTPGFATIMRDIGLAEYWRRSGHRPDYLGLRPLP